MSLEPIPEFQAMKAEACSLAWPIERSFVARKYDRRFRHRKQIEYWQPKYQAKGNGFMASQCVQLFWFTKSQRSIVVGLVFFFLNWWHKVQFFVILIWILFALGIVLGLIGDVRRRTIKKMLNPSAEGPTG